MTGLSIATTLQIISVTCAVKCTSMLCLSLTSVTTRDASSISSAEQKQEVSSIRIEVPV
jgi:hypothetical protein